MATLPQVGLQNTYLLRIVIGAPVRIERQGKSDICDRLIAAVEPDVMSVSNRREVEIQYLQTMSNPMPHEAQWNVDKMVITLRVSASTTLESSYLPGVL